ncbi:MAG: hypothetical protein ACSHX7_14490 [Luteolibacter sp.]
MKIRTSIIIILLIGLSVIGWLDHCKLTALREKRDHLTSMAMKHGMSMESFRFTKRQRPDQRSEAKLAAARFIRHHIAGGDLAKSRGTSAADSLEWMASLDSGQIRIVIEEILNDPELDGKSRRKLIGLAVEYLLRSDPAGVLSIFSEFDTHLKDTSLGREIVRRALAILAKDNPHTAIGWVRKHANQYPEIGKSAQTILIANISKQDPTLAFEIIREFGPQRDLGAEENSIIGSSTLETRTKVISALRQHLATISDEGTRREVEQRAWQGLARALAKDDFEAGSKWLTSVSPTHDELSSTLGMLDSGLINARKTDDIGLWVEWAAETLPAEDYEKFTLQTIKSWSVCDPRSTGEWINASPDGTMKYTAIREYAPTLAFSEPEGATQWAMTLPPGKERNETLKAIQENIKATYINWPKDDPEGAAAFAKQQGIK